MWFLYCKAKIEKSEKSCYILFLLYVWEVQWPYLSLSGILKLICYMKTQLCCRESVPQVAGGKLGRRQHCQRWRWAEVLVLSGKDRKIWKKLLYSLFTVSVIGAVALFKFICYIKLICYMQTVLLPWICATGFWRRCSCRRGVEESLWEVGRSCGWVER